MRQIACRLTEYFIQKGVIPSDERDVYEYGFDITLYTLLSTLGLLAIGVILRQLVNTAVLIAIFYTCQSFGGGYHAPTHLRCFLSMCVGLTAGLALLWLPVDELWFALAGGASIAALLVIPLVLHPNKSYLQPQAPQLRTKSRIATLLCVLLCALLVVFVRLPLRLFATGFILAALSRLYAWMRARKR